MNSSPYMQTPSFFSRISSFDAAIVASIAGLWDGLRNGNGRQRKGARRVCILLAGIMWGWGASCQTILAQMSATPPRLMLTHHERSAEVVLYNPGADILEVSTGLGYTLQYADSLGNSGLRGPVTEEEEKKRCDLWVQVYPARFIIQPNSSRTVRLLIVPPSDLEEGEYWGRLRLTGTPTAFGSVLPGDSVAGIEMRIRTQVVLDLPIILRIGSVSTAVMLDAVALRRNTQGGVEAFVRTVRSGNAAYRGTMYGELRKSDGTPVAQTSAQFTTEFDFWRSLSFGQVPPGDYMLHVRAVSEKKGSAMDAVILSPTVKATYGVRLTDTAAVITSRP